MTGEHASAYLHGPVDGIVPGLMGPCISGLCFRRRCAKSGLPESQPLVARAPSQAITGSATTEREREREREKKRERGRE